jgi:putative membrane protein insertion efficiency factor
MASHSKIKNGLIILIVALIKWYRFMISLLLGHCCRFEPTCSQYAIEAFQKKGCLVGCRLMIKRLLRCHPWHPGGLDEVPK